MKGYRQPLWWLYGVFTFPAYLSLFRRARQSAPKPTARPCGCAPPAYCLGGQQILARVSRGERLAGETGQWATHTQALVELAIHLDREPSEVRAMLRHPVGR